MFEDRGTCTAETEGIRRCALVATVFMLLLIATIATAQSSGGGIPCRYEIAHIIQGPSCPVTQSPAVTVGMAISPSGRWVAGYYRLCGPSGNRVFLYDTTTGQFITLPLVESSFAFANDVNEEYVVGSAGDEGFLNHIGSGQITLLPPVAGSGGVCSVSAINSSNMVCGTRAIQANPARTTAFRWSAKTGFEDLGLINGESTGARDLNDSGTVIGSLLVEGMEHSFRWNGDGAVDVGTLGERLPAPHRKKSRDNLSCPDIQHN